MASAFDPYYEWLGIPPREQPPTAYRLLGIELFESNPHVIQNAAERQTTYVRSRQLGPQQEAAARLLNEISAARVLLLDPRRKAEYDAQLAAQQPGAMPQIVTRLAAAPPTPPPVTPPAKAEPAPLRAELARPPLAFGQPLWWGVVAAGTLFLLGIGYLVWHSTTGSPAIAAAKPEESPPRRQRPPKAGDLPEVDLSGTSVAADPRPPKRALKPKRRKDDPLDPIVIPGPGETEPPPKPAKEPPATDPSSEAALIGLADSLLGKLLKSDPTAEPPAPDPALKPAKPPPGKPPKGKPPREDFAPRMSYRVERTQEGFKVTIDGTPFGVANVLLAGDFGPGTMHVLTRRVPVPDELDPDRQPLIEVEIADGAVARVEWDGKAVRRGK